VLLHSIYLNDYNGALEGFYPGGFKWAADQGYGAEVFNFQPVAGRCYGHVELLEKQIRLEKHFEATKDDDAIEGVLVAWTAPDPTARNGRLLVGWYKNATLYRKYQTPTGKFAKARTFKIPTSKKTHILSYRVEADAADCRLLTPEERVLWLPPRPRGTHGMPGQSATFFPDEQNAIGQDIGRRIRQFIATGEDISLAEAAGKSRPKGGGYSQIDPERRKKIENTAMEIVTAHFRKLGYTVVDVSEKDLGYDLTATRGDVVLCIEVKGRSGVDVIADFTFNEYDKIKLEQDGVFAEGSYRICIVTDTLSENGGAKFHHFWYVNPTPKETGVLTGWRNINGAGFLDLEKMEAARGRHQTD